MVIPPPTTNMDFLKFSVVVFVFCSVGSSPVQVSDLNRGMTEFARDFYSQCVQTKSGNVIVSPLSVANALALLSQGTSGKTFDELKTALHLSNDKTATANQFLEHHENLRKSAGEPTLSIANRIYVQKGKQISRNFQDVVVSKFMSSVDSIDFVDSQKSAQTINDFVLEKTNGKIKDIVKPDELNSNTRSVLINAIYFRSIWEKPFKKQSTTKKDFYTQNEKQSVDFMFVEDEFNYADLEALGSSALEMKYANSNISFVIVLPNDRMGLKTLETKLETYDWTEITGRMYSRKVAVHVPKFKVEYELKLDDVLKNMGMTEMFSGSGGLNGILESGESLAVSKVIHKAFIEINEEGTEAAAATGFEVVRPMVPLPPHRFIVDHPFMYFIRDTETNTIIFSGRIEKF